MKKSLTIIWWLPWVWKSTLWDALEKIDDKIVHCDYDKVFETIIKNPKALSSIANDYIPEHSRLAFLIWDKKQIVKTIMENNEVKWIFQGAVFLWSINVLKIMQDTKNTSLWIINIDWTNKDSRKLIKELSILEWFDKVNFIELITSKNELVKTAREREIVKNSNFPLLDQNTNITVKLNEYQVIERIKEYEPYNTSEKLFNKYLRVTRKEVSSEMWIKKLANWIKKA